MSLTRTFHDFSRLPEELQIEIWKCAAQFQRIISVYRLHLSLPEYHCHHETHEPPTMLQACRLSRLIGLESYRVLSHDHGLRHPVYFSPASDVVYCGGMSGYRMLAREIQGVLGAGSGFRFVVFKANDLTCMGALWAVIDGPLRKRGLSARYARSEGLGGIYNCAQCGCRVSQLYGLEFKWTSSESNGRGEQSCKGSGKAQQKLNIRVLGRWDIDREFGDGPWNRDRCLACPSHQGLIRKEPCCLEGGNSY